MGSIIKSLMTEGSSGEVIHFDWLDSGLAEFMLVAKVSN